MMILNRKLPASLAALFCSASMMMAAPPAPFTSDWESLKQYRCPEWFRDAKFGIWSVWGPQAVPGAGDWYARFMYVQGTWQNKLHVKKYGHPSKVGYKDVVALWKAEKFDEAQAERLIKLYKAAGARYFVSMGVHHDNFDLWNSKHHKWNAVNMGPKKDIIGMWAEAARGNGLRFGVSEHLERAYSWFNTNKGSDKEGPLAGVPYDGNDPAYADFYFPPHEDTREVYPKDPPEWWTHQWRDRINDLVESYRPDFLYTDGGIPFGEVGRSVVANFYNKNMKWHDGKLEAVYTLKDIGGGHGDYARGVGVLDMERGVLPKIEELPWQTCTSIGDWFYNPGWKYQPVSWTVHMLVDVVSKNGNLLVNVVQRPDGTIDPEAEQLLKAMAVWMDVHGEAIYGTRPWLVYGEGTMHAEGGSQKEDYKYSANDIRFTTKGDALYAIALGWPADGKLLIRSLAIPAGKIDSVALLGSKDKLTWRQTKEGLEVELPATPVSSYTTALKVGGKDLKPAPLPGIKADAAGIITLLPEKAALKGSRIRVQKLDGKSNIGFWSEPGDYVVWRANFPKAGTYRISMLASTPVGGQPFVVEVGEVQIPAAAAKTSGWSDFQTVNVGEIVIKEPGDQSVTVRAKDAASWKAIGLQWLVFTPKP